MDTKEAETLSEHASQFPHASRSSRWWVSVRLWEGAARYGNLVILLELHSPDYMLVYIAKHAPVLLQGIYASP